MNQNDISKRKETTLKMCAYIYDKKESFNVLSVDLMRKRVFVESNDQKVNGYYDFKDLYLCHCKEGKNCEKRN